MKKTTTLISLAYLLAYPEVGLANDAIKNIKAPHTLDQECKDFIKTLPTGYTFGWASVPEDAANHSDSKMISVFYYHNYKPGKVPVVFFNGGPTQSSHGVHSSFSGFADNRGIGMIYFDQRGTGCSTRIDMNQPETEIVRRSSHYGTFEIAHDAEVLRKKILGTGSWILFGQSFGVSIANRYLTLFPNHVKSVHAYAGQHFDNFVEFYKGRMKAQQDVMLAHEHVYPGTIARIRKAKAALGPNDCVEVDGSNICGPVLLDNMFVFLSGMPHLTKPLIDKVIDENGVSSLETIKTQLSFALTYHYSKTLFVSQTIYRNVLESVGSLMHLAQDCEIAYKELEAEEGIKKKDLVIDECNVISQVSQIKNFYPLFKSEFQTTNYHPTVTSEQIYRTLQAHPRIKYYASSSGMDPFSGYYPIMRFAAGSKQIVYKHYSWLGHGGYRFTPEFWDDMVKN